MEASGQKREAETRVVLDPDDDYGSVRTRLEAAGASRVALIVPRRCPKLRHPLALRLLRRYADDFGLELTLVTRDSLLAQLAREHGLPVYTSVRALEGRRAWQKALGQMPSPARWLLSHTGALANAALIIVLLGLLVASLAYFLVPTMTVELALAGQDFSERVEIRADPLVKMVNSAARQVPARVVEVEAEGTQHVPATGKKAVPGAKARGQVVFANRTTEAVPVPKGTVVSTTSGIAFETTDEATVPAGLLATATVSIQAAQPGPSGNVAALSIDRLEGPLGLRLAVINELPTSGGADRMATVVNAADRDQARAILFDRLQREAMDQLFAQRKEQESLPAQSVSITVVAEEYDRKPGEEALALNLKMKLRATGTAFDGRDVDTLLREVWRAKTQSQASPPRQSLRTQPPEVLRVDGPAVIFAMNLSGTAAASLNEDEMKRQLRGKTAAEAVQYLKNTLPLAKPPAVLVQPEWAQRAFRVRIILEGSTARPGA